MKPNLNLKGSQGCNVEPDKPLNQSLQSGSENISSMSSNGPPRNTCGALEVNLKTCAKGTKGRVYSFIKIYSLNLLKPLSNQPSFISQNHSIFIHLIFENPFCSNGIHIFWFRHLEPNFIYRELIWLFMKSLYPSFIIQSFFNIFLVQFGRCSNHNLSHLAWIVSLLPCYPHCSQSHCSMDGS